MSEIKNKPAAKLPFTVEPYFNDKLVMCDADTKPFMELLGTPDDSDYLLHAANAYPKMVAMLRTLKGRAVGVEDLRRELGEE